MILSLRHGAVQTSGKEGTSIRFVATGEAREISSDELSLPTSAASMNARDPGRARATESPFDTDGVFAFHLPASCSYGDSWVPHSRRAKYQKDKAMAALAPTLTGVSSVAFRPDFIVFAIRAGVLVCPSASQLTYLHDHQNNLKL